MDFLCLAVLWKPQKCSPQQKIRGEMCYKYTMGVSVTFMMASESKDAACPASMLFHSQRNAGVGLEHTKRFKRSSWKDSNLWEPGSRARKMGLSPCLQGAHSCGGGSKAVVCVFRQIRATQTWPTHQIQLLLPLSPEIIMVCFPFFNVLSTMLLFLCFTCWHMDQSL